MHDREHEAAIAAAGEAAEWHAEREGLAVTFDRIVVVGESTESGFNIEEPHHVPVPVEPH